MVGLSEQLTGRLRECVSLGLQIALAAPLDFGSVVEQVLGGSGEESIDLLTNLGSRAKAGIGGDAFAKPVQMPSSGLKSGL